MADNKTIEIVLSAIDTGLSATFKAAGKAVSSTVQNIDSDLKTIVGSGKAFDKTMRDLGSSLGDFQTKILGAAAAIGGFSLFEVAAKSAFSFNRTVEDSKIGIAALVRTFTGTDLGTSFVKAEEIQKSLQIAGLKTTATYQELLRALQEGIGPALREGFNTQQIVAFTQQMTQAASALSLPMDQLGQELRAILDGTIDRNARIANALQIKNSDIVQWKEAGTLFQNLEKRLSSFKIAGQQASETFSGALSNVKDAIQFALGTGTERTFYATTAALLKMQGAIVSVDEATMTITFNEKIKAALDDIDKRISKFISSISSDDIGNALTAIVQSGAAVIEVLSGLTGSVLSIMNTLGPLAPEIVKATLNLILFTTGWKLLSFALLEPYRLIKSLYVAFVELTGLQVVVWLNQVRNALTFTQVAALGLTGAIGGLAGAFGAWMLGYQIGTWLYNQFNIVKEAGNRIAASLTYVALSAKQMWAWLTGGDTAAIQMEINEAKQIYDGLYRDISTGTTASAEVQKKAQADVTTSVSGSLSGQKRLTDEVLRKMEERYHDYAKKIIELQGDIDRSQRDFAEKIRNVQQGGMSNIQQWKDNQAQALEYIKMAKEASAASKKAFESGDFTGAKLKYDEMLDAIQKSSSAAGQLGKEVTANDKALEASARTAKSRYEGLKAAFEERAANLEGRGLDQEYIKQKLEKYKKEVDLAKAAYDAIQAKADGANSQIIKTDAQGRAEEIRLLTEANTVKIEAMKQYQKNYADVMTSDQKKAGIDDISTKLDEFEKKWLEKWTSMREVAGSSIGGVNSSFGSDEERDSLMAKSKDFGDRWKEAYAKFVKDGSESIVELENKLQILTKDREIKVSVTEVPRGTADVPIERSSGGIIGYMRGGLLQALAAGGSVLYNILSGGHLPGFGGGDTVPLLGERGEVMLNKYAVKAGGLRAALAFNSGNWDIVIEELLKRTHSSLNDILGYTLGGAIKSLPQPVQSLSSGGMSAGISAAPIYNLTLNYSGPASQSSARDMAKMVVGELQKMHRGRS